MHLLHCTFTLSAVKYGLHLFSLRKQPTFHHQCWRKKGRDSILMMCHYSELGFFNKYPDQYDCKYILKFAKDFSWRNQCINPEISEDVLMISKGFPINALNRFHF